MSTLAFLLACVPLWLLLRPRRLPPGTPTAWELILRAALLPDQGRPGVSMGPQSLESERIYEERRRGVMCPRRQRRTARKVVRMRRSA